MEIVTGDLDGNGRDEIAIDFGTAGLWIWLNDTGRQQLHHVSPEQMAVGELF